MECNKAAQMILDGVLDKGGVELAELREHAAHCDACRKELNAYEILVSGISTLEEQVVPSRVRAGIMSAVAPKQLSCRVVKSFLSGVCDDELSWSESDSVRYHINNCQDCASDLESIGFVAAEIRGLEAVAPPERVRTQIYERIHAQELSRTNLVWKGSWNKSWGGVTVAACAALFAVIYANMPAVQQASVTPTIYMGNRSAMSPPTLGYLPKLIHDQSAAVDPAAKNGLGKHDEFPHSYIGPTFKSFSSNSTEFIKVASNRRPLDTAKAVSVLFKKNKSNKQTVDAKSYSVIPDADDAKYELKENEPVNVNSEPEVVASVAGTNVNSEYAGDEHYFTKVAEKVQNKNRLDEWLEKSKSYTEEAKLSKKSANIQILGFKF